MSKIAIIIKTTPKRRSLLWVINSVELSLSDISFRFYIADEEPIDDWKEELYEKLDQKGHYIKIWEKRKSVTKARNHLISQLQDEEYVLRLDDDFELGGEFNIQNMLTLLERDDIDFCADLERQIGDGKSISSGELRIESGQVKFKNNSPPDLIFKKDSAWKYNEYKGVRFAKADYMRNLILIKKHCFDEVKWNENLKFTGEHLDFYLALKANGFQGVFTPDSIHLHRDDLKQITISIQEEKKWRHLERIKIKTIEYNRKWNGEPVKKYWFGKRLISVLKKLLLKVDKYLFRGVKNN